MLTISELKEMVPQLQTMLLSGNLDDVQLAGGIITDLPEHYKAILFSNEPNKCNVCHKYGPMGKEAYLKWLKYKTVKKHNDQYANISFKEAIRKVYGYYGYEFNGKF